MKKAGRESKFEVHSVLTSRKRRCDITETEFNELKRARTFLIDYKQFEESVFQLLLAVKAYEEFLLNTALDYCLFPQAEYDDLHDTRLQANLRVLGFLNSLTSFRDQFPIFDSLPSPKAPKKKFGEIWDQYKSDSVALRFCEKVRNYAQHQTQPVSYVNTRSGWDDKREFMETNVSIFLNTMDLCCHRSIKKSESDEYLEKYGEKANISTVIRESAAVLGGIITDFRDSISHEFNENAEAYEKFLDLGGVSDSGRRVSLVTHRKGSDLVEEIQIFEEFIKRVRKLRSTFLMTNNHKHFVSNRILTK